MSNKATSKTTQHWPPMGVYLGSYPTGPESYQWDKWVVVPILKILLDKCGTKPMRLATIQRSGVSYITWRLFNIPIWLVLSNWKDKLINFPNSSEKSLWVQQKPEFLVESSQVALDSLGKSYLYTGQTSVKWRHPDWVLETRFDPELSLDPVSENLHWTKSWVNNLIYRECDEISFRFGYILLSMILCLYGDLKG